jgi:hypothetical protein
MRSLILASMLLGSSLLSSSAVLADDRVVVPLPVPQVVPGDSDRRDTDRDLDRDYRARCETKTVHRENDMGDSKTVQSEHCD